MSALKPVNCLIVVEATPQMDGTWWVGGSTFLDDSAALKWLPDTPETRGSLLADTVLRSRIDALRAELRAATTFAQNHLDEKLKVLEAHKALRAELERERARLDLVLNATVKKAGNALARVRIGVRDIEVPAGQTARDVIDRLIKESKP